MSRKQKKATKRELRKARTKQRRRLFNYVLYGLVGVVILSTVLFLVLPRLQQPSPGQVTLPGQAIPNMGNQHIPSVDSPHAPYNSDPPTSGPHIESIASWGIHDQPIPKELQVHNLEDGGVIVHYHPDAPQEVVERLKQIVGRYPSQVILTPYPDLDTTIALTAWTRLDKMDELDEERITSFISAYRGIDHHVP